MPVPRRRRRPPGPGLPWCSTAIRHTPEPLRSAGACPAPAEAAATERRTRPRGNRGGTPSSAATPARTPRRRVARLGRRRVTARSGNSSRRYGGPRGHRRRRALLRRSGVRAGRPRSSTGERGVPVRERSGLPVSRSPAGNRGGCSSVPIRVIGNRNSCGWLDRRSPDRIRPGSPHSTAAGPEPRRGRSTVRPIDGCGGPKGIPRLFRCACRMVCVKVTGKP